MKTQWPGRVRDGSGVASITSGRDITGHPRRHRSQRHHRTGRTLSSFAPAVLWTAIGCPIRRNKNGSGGDYRLHPGRSAAKTASVALSSLLGCHWLSIRRRPTTTDCIQAVPEPGALLKVAKNAKAKSAPRDLWRGFARSSRTMLLSTPYSVIMFSTYQSLKPHLTSENAASNIGGCFLAGAACEDYALGSVWRWCTIHWKFDCAFACRAICL